METTQSDMAVILIEIAEPVNAPLVVMAVMALKIEVLRARLRESARFPRYRPLPRSPGRRAVNRKNGVVLSWNVWLTKQISNYCPFVHVEHT